MALRWGSLIGLTVVLAACSAAPEANQGPQQGAPAGETQLPSATPAGGEPAEAEAQPGGGDTIGQVAQPGEANMGAVTPGTTGGGGPLVEQPRPGAPGPQGQIDRATRDLAARIGAEPAAITVQTVENVEWPDGSLGCPQPGLGYTQAIVAGHRIVLAAGGQSYTYHADTRTTVVLCVNGQPAP